MMHPSRTSLCLCRGSDTILSIANADCLCRGSDTADCLCRGSTMDATAPPTANAAAAPPEDGPYTRPRLSIVDAAATSTAGAAAAPAKVGPTWRQGPCLHPEPESAPLPPSPPLLPPAERTACSDNARNPPPAADRRFHPLHPCLRVEMARTPRPRGARARPYTEASCICRCARTSGRPGGDLNRPFPWTRATQRGKR